MRTHNELMRLFGLTLLFACVAPAWGHEPMQHSCSPPIRPVNDQDDVQWQRFLNEIDAFRDCVTGAKDRHEAAVRSHQAAAREAVEAWTEFVRSSLNAPEDFPWPPEEERSQAR